MSRLDLRLLMFAPVILALASCGTPPDDKMQAAFVRALDRWFNSQNEEAVSRKDVLLIETEAYQKNPSLAPPTGTQYNSFHFNDKGVIAYNVRCGRKGCEQVYLVVDYYGKEKLCSRCGAVLIKKKEDDKIDTASWMRKEMKADVRPMFEVKQKGKPMTAVVRYIRRNWVFDPRGKSDIDVGKMGSSTAKVEIKTDYLPGAGGKVAAGFHRPDAVYVVEQEFEFDGSDAKPVGNPREEAVRPWKEQWNTRTDVPWEDVIRKVDEMKTTPH